MVVMRSSGKLARISVALCLPEFAIAIKSQALTESTEKGFLAPTSPNEKKDAEVETLIPPMEGLKVSTVEELTKEHDLIDLTTDDATETESKPLKAGELPVFKGDNDQSPTSAGKKAITTEDDEKPSIKPAVEQPDAVMVKASTDPNKPLSIKERMAKFNGGGSSSSLTAGSTPTAAGMKPSAKKFGRVSQLKQASPSSSEEADTTAGKKTAEVVTEKAKGDEEEKPDVEMKEATSPADGEKQQEPETSTPMEDEKTGVTSPPVAEDVESKTSAAPEAAPDAAPSAPAPEDDEPGAALAVKEKKEENKAEEQQLSEDAKLFQTLCEEDESKKSGSSSPMFQAAEATLEESPAAGENKTEEMSPSKIKTEYFDMTRGGPSSGERVEGDASASADADSATVEAEPAVRPVVSADDGVVTMEPVIVQEEKQESEEKTEQGDATAMASASASGVSAAAAEQDGSPSSSSPSAKPAGKVKVSDRVKLFEQIIQKGKEKAEKNK
ncbi:unnamed protein product [Amoebophrya sp. A120]|nr:unnamed protein product [Amoebophrya sp. A120]|eukprot:GSA120T00018838001.1